jgi:RHS repeat-associated protein
MSAFQTARNDAGHSIRRWIPLLFVIALVVQGLHQIEHVVQVLQVKVWHSANTHGVAGSVFDTEWVHVFYNLPLFLALAALAFGLVADGARAPRWVWRIFAGGTAIQGYHVIEHSAKLGQHIDTGVSPAPGLVGGHVDLVWFHFSINLVVLACMAIGFFGLGMQRLLPVGRGTRTRLASALASAAKTLVILVVGVGLLALPPTPLQAQTGDTTPPAVTLDAPVDGATIGGTSTLSATSTDDTSLSLVDFLVDGQVVGSKPVPPPAYDPTVKSDSPVAYWRLGESSGTAAEEEMNNLDGTYVGSPTLGASGLLTGDANTAVGFDGSTTKRVEVADNSLLDVTGDITVEAWVKTPGSLPNAVRTAVSKAAGTTNGKRQYGLGLTSANKLRAVVFIGSKQYEVVDSAPVSANTTYHVALTRSGSTLRLYVDGTEVGTPVTASGSLNSTNGKLWIGTVYATAAEAWNGTIDEVAVYNTALSSPRIAEHHATGKGSGSTKQYNASFDWDTTTVSDGPVDIKARAIDTSGNSATSAIARVTVKNANTVPTVTLDAPADGQTVTGSHTLTATASDNKSLQDIEFLVDGNIVGTKSAKGTNAYDTTVSSDSPVAHWRLGETSTSTAKDRINNLDGSYVGPPGVGARGLITNDSNRAVTFDGSTTERVEVADNALLNATADLTVETWLKTPATLGSQTRTAVSKANGTTNATRQYSLGLTAANKLSGSVFMGDVEYAVTGTTAVSPSSIYQVVMTRSGQTLSLFVNGAEVATTTTAAGSLNSTTGKLWLGTLWDTSAEAWDGTVDEVALYLSALSAARISAHYSSGSATAPVTAYTASFAWDSWGVDDGAHDVTARAVDFSGNIGSSAVARVTVNNGAGSGSDYSYIYDDAGQLLAVVNPSGATAIYSYDKAGNITEIKRRASSVVSVLEFSPNAATVGSSVTIYGTGFGATPADNTVKFNGQTATVTSASATKLVATVPAGATDGPISVTAPGGSANSATNFSVTAEPAAPSVQTLSADIGVGGDTLTITGSGFAPNPEDNRVLFADIIRGRVTAASPTSLTAVVPKIPTEGPISVITPGGKATSAGSFQIIPAPYQVTDVDTNIKLASFSNNIISVPVNADGHIGLLRFDATKGQRLGLATKGTSGWETVFSMHDPYGRVIMSRRHGDTTKTYWEWDSGLDTDYGPVTLPYTGTYTLVVDPDAATENTTIYLYNVPDDVGGTIVSGTSKSITITAPLQNARFSFSASAGQTVTATKTSSSGIATGSYGIYDPSGQQVADRAIGFGSNSVGPLALTTTGEHTLRVDPFKEDTGTFSFTFSLTGGGETLSSLSTRSAVSTQESVSGSSVKRTSQDSYLVAANAPANSQNRSASAGSTELASVTASAALAAPSGITALSGIIKTMDRRPLPNATLMVGDVVTKTDRYGRFLLRDIPAGHQVLTLDARTANRDGNKYGFFMVGLDIDAERTNALPYTIWMPKLDMKNSMWLPSPTKERTVLKTPRIPGLKAIIPKGTIIRDVTGKIVHRVSITPVSTKRPPFPLPEDMNVPTYFTLQPGGAMTESVDGAKRPGIKLIFPNSADYERGQRVDYWSYDPALEESWFTYGLGTVTSDGKRIVPDKGVTIDRFTCAFFGLGNFPASFSKFWDLLFGGDPVDLGTGIFQYRKTDLAVSDVMPLSLERAYRPGDGVSRNFGIGSNHSYDWRLQGGGTMNGLNFTWAELVTENGSRIRFNRTSPGTHYEGAVMAPQGPVGPFVGSRLTFDRFRRGWDLTLRDGTVYEFFTDFWRSDNKDETTWLSAIVDRFGNRTNIARVGGDNRVSGVISPNGRWISFGYDSSKRINRVEDNTGRGVDYTYDATGRLWKVTDTGGGVTEYGYDTSNRMTTIKDPRNITFLTNVYDTSGRVIKQTQADGSVYEFIYTLNGSAVTQTDVKLKTSATGSVVSTRRVSFDASGFPASDTYALGTPQEQTYTFERYPTTNLIKSVTDDLLRKTTYEYAPNGNVTKVTWLDGTADAISSSFTYEPKFNQLETVTDPLTHVSRYGYDADGVLTSVTDATNRKTDFVLDAQGRITKVTDPATNVTDISYSMLGDRVTVTDPNGSKSASMLDEAGRQAELTDGTGAVTKYAYNPHNLVTRVTDALGNETAFEYDPNGNMTKVIDPKLNATIFAYNNMDRLESRDDPSTAPVETFEYDVAGNLTKHTDRRGKATRYRYDALNRMTFAGFGAAGDPEAYSSTIDYTHDDGNRLRTAVDSAFGTMNLDYDSFDRLTQESGPRGTLSYGYDAASRRQTMTATGQPQVSYGYDNANRLTSIARGTNTVGLDYDTPGRLKTVTLPNGVVGTYGYNAAWQLTSIDYAKAASPVGGLAYGYDLAGRRTKVGGSLAQVSIPAARAASGIDHDTSNRLTKWANTTINYDANGNVTNDGTYTFSWNDRNQMASITQSQTTVASFTYDPFGRRAKRVVDGTTTQYLHDGDNVIQEQNAAGSATADLLTGLGVDDTFARIESGTTTSLLTDALGSTVGLTDATGAITTSYAYQPFGKTTASGGASSNSFQFTGRENDGGGAGLYFYRGRYYNPTWGRFISEDPIGFAGGDSNLYAYVGNSPTNFVDPQGESLVLPAALAGGTLGPALVAGGLILVGGALLADAISTAGRKAAESSVSFSGSSGSGGGPRCTGQKHHLISKKVHDALEQHPVLKGKYKARDNRFVKQAVDRSAHRGYQKWHRDLDGEVAKWIGDNPTATTTMFEQWLTELYMRSDLLSRFPSGC